jgi:hypothetical protein
MENDNNKDHLDHFLRKTFDGFEANPSDAVWGRLSNSLQPTPLATPVSLIKGWHIALVVSAAIGVVTLQHFYFSNQIKKLHQQVAEQNSVIAARVNALQKQQHENTKNIILNSNEKKNVTSVASQNSTMKKAWDAVTPTTVVGQSPTKSVGNHTGYPAVANTADIRTVPVSNTDQSVSTLSEPAPVLFVDDQTNLQRPTKLTFRPVMLASASLAKKIYSENIVPKVALVNLGTTKVSHHTNHLSLGIHAMSAFSTTKVSEKEPLFGTPPSGGGRLFLENESTQGKVFVAGISLQKPLSSRWALVSGIDYQQQKSSKTIQPKLRFDDRNKHSGDPHGGGGWPHGGHSQGTHDHEFNYFIGTSTGSYLLEVGLTQKDTNQMIPMDKSINFDVAATSKTTMISVPLGVEYAWVSGKWRIFSGAGLRFNMILENRQELNRFNCNSNDFDVNRQPYLTPTIKRKAVLTSNVYFSSGLEYQWSNLSCYIAPNCALPFSKGRDPKVEIKNTWAGLDFGIRYHISP